MKPTRLFCSALLLPLAFGLLAPLSAEEKEVGEMNETTSIELEELKLDDGIDHLEAEVVDPEGERDARVAHLAAKYGVEESAVRGLLGDGDGLVDDEDLERNITGWGDVELALLLAKAKAGQDGIPVGRALEQVVRMRRADRSWGDISRGMDTYGK